MHFLGLVFEMQIYSDTDFENIYDDIFDFLFFISEKQIL